MSLHSIFTRIINRELPSYIVCEDKENIAFLDINPLRRGHTLIVPKLEVDNIFSLNKNSYNSLFSFAKKVAINMKKKIACNRIGMSVVGLDVPHAHIHLIPINSFEDMNFNKSPLKLTEEEMLNICQLLKFTS
ncbi:HIT family protein [Bacteroidota bacterium]|nr:HIT family protein [Bacteroidota bacterium]MDC3115580.1 HIT family protein [Bacteroidota bacterium]MDC3129847.1 HIT family protein [Bacteroidota bacterium]MDC3229820.1 HIT family protein [Bacteroidota bacterium]